MKPIRVRSATTSSLQGSIVAFVADPNVGTLAIIVWDDGTVREQNPASVVAVEPVSA